MKSRAPHAPMDQFPVVKQQLYIGGMPLKDLSDRMNDQPFYAYDQQVINSQVSELRGMLPRQVKLHYALKANPMRALVSMMSKLVDGLDVASVGELELALKTELSPDNISFAGPGKQNHELRSAIESGIIISAESESEIERIAELSKLAKNQAKVAIRINPDFELKTSGMKMGGGPKPFGIDAEKVPSLLQAMGAMDIDFQGFHIYSGSQNLNSQALIEMQNQLFELAAELSENSPSPLKWLNIGGGFGIPYFPGEKHLDITPVTNNLTRLVEQYRSCFSETEIVLELGRYLVGSAGLYVCQVIDKKRSRGETFLVTNGGLHHHLAASGNFGQVIRKNYPVVIGNKMGIRETEVVTVVGPLCTPLDIIADQVELPIAEIGDLICVYQSGAYGLSASPTQFLGHPPPGEILI